MAVLKVRRYGDPVLRRRAVPLAQVTPSEWVTLEAQDLEGRPVALTARGLRARVFQHEIDHLDGVLFIDRLEPVVRDRIKRRIKKEGFSEDAGAGGRPAGAAAGAIARSRVARAAPESRSRHRRRRRVRADPAAGGPRR